MLLKLNNLRKLKTNYRKRVGRGIGSGSGKTCGRGVKGQKARTGSAMKGFEGGQTPIYMRLPKRGFKNISAKKYEVVNLVRFLELVEKKKINTAILITKEELLNLGLVKNVTSKVKLIMGNKKEVNTTFKFKVDIYSKKASCFAA